MFRNPSEGKTAARLIQSCGLKRFEKNGARVSEKHANFIQLDEGGSADDVRALMRIVRDRVESTSGFTLRSEIRLVGFEDEEY